MMVYKFNTMFRGQAVVIEYGYADISQTKLDYAIINYDNKSFIHPNYELSSDWLDTFHFEVYELAKNHIKKIVK